MITFTVGKIVDSGNTVATQRKKQNANPEGLA